MTPVVGPFIDSSEHGQRMCVQESLTPCTLRASDVQSLNATRHGPPVVDGSVSG